MAIFIPSTINATAKDVARHYVTHVFAKHGLPTDIVSDRGNKFASRFWRSLADSLQIKLNFSTAYHPQSDGQTERVNQVLEQHLRIFTNYQQSDWSEWLSLAEFEYNNATHASTEVTPFFANKGFHPNSDFVLTKPIDDVNPAATRFVAELSELFSFLRENIQHAQEQSTIQANKRRLPAPEYRVGQKVFSNITYAA
ncbi:hypothetical protein B9479_008213 [Cryptococcus floricola]|uniref:Integrase catalytic domain-containing protein n=1 Tax=Cryptococcus floricola TaxID=2591691 RepID=A0A5D3AI14_9TREE|nr:hypothetical protein B9479_008213 [Cryptococcus floricola]